MSLQIYQLTEELYKRETLFEQNNNINKFIFETPFTKSGKAHGDTAEQYKKKTILTVQGCFPHIKKRFRVVEKQELILSPIETAVELISRKIVNLKTELNTATPNLKFLQMNLQGILLIQVNAGPLEICRVFLGDNMTKYSAEHVNLLIQCMNELVRCLGRGLEVNQQHLKPDQLILQRELEQAYEGMKAEVSKYMTLSLVDDEDAITNPNSTADTGETAAVEDED